MDGIEVVSSASLSMLVLEGLKYLLRLVMQNPLYDINPKLYAVLLPVLNVALVPALALLDWATMPTDWAMFGQTVAQAIVSSLVAVLIYNNTLKGFKASVRQFNAYTR